MQTPAAPAAAAPVIEEGPKGPAGHGFTNEDLKHALRAFKKRLKLARLDQESKLGRSPLSGGRSSDIEAIMPPRDFPDAIWDALVSEGLLRRRGTGFFELTSE